MEYVVLQMISSIHTSLIEENFSLSLDSIKNMLCVNMEVPLFELILFLIYINDLNHAIK